MNRYLAAALAAILVVGCGGGSGSGASGEPPAGGTPITFGDFSLVGTLNTPPISSSTESSEVYGFAGTIATARLNDVTPTIEETTVVVADYLGRIFLMNGDGSGRRLVYDGPSGSIDSVAITDAGNRIFFSESGTIKSLTLGGSPTVLTSGNDVALSPDGTKLAFRRVNVLWRCALNGTNAVQVKETGIGIIDRVKWMGDAAIAYEADVAGPTNLIYITNLAGTLLQTRPGTFFSTSRDGRYASYSVYAEPAFASYRVPITGSTLEVGVPVGVESFSDYPSAFLADSTKILTQIPTNSDSAFNLRVFDLVRGTSGATLDTFETFGTVPLQMDATPYVTERYFVGSGSPNVSAVAGILLGQSNDATKSILLFNATTWSTAQIKLLSQEQNTVYDVWADRITSLTYSNDANFLFKSGFVGSAVINGAIVTFNSEGRVASVLPYNLTRAGGHPRVVGEGGRKFVEGDFLAHFDADGRDLAPGGVSKVELP